MPDDGPPGTGRGGWRPLAEHTPLTMSEAGLELDSPPRRRWWVIGGAVVAVVAIAMGALLLRGGDGRPSVVEVDLGACVAPVVSDVDAPVDVVDCSAGAARVVARQRHPGTAADVHPGDGALVLFGQGACQGRVEAAVLTVAVPTPTSWAAGERTVACLERL